jgi:UvrD-like helicase family protein
MLDDQAAIANAALASGLAEHQLPSLFSRAAAWMKRLRECARTRQNFRSRKRSDSGRGAAAWANQVLEIIGERLRIIPASHRTTVRVEEKYRSRSTRCWRAPTPGRLDEAIQGLERQRKVHVMGGADPLIRLIRGAWDLHRGKPASGELVMFASWDELKAAATGQKDGAPGDPALQVLVRLIKDRDRRVLQMCRQLEACVASPAVAQITVSTVHKAEGLEWPWVSMSPDFNQFVELEHGTPVIDLEEAYVMYVAVTRGRKKLLLSPACAEIISASAAAKAGRARQASNDAERPAELHGSRSHRSPRRLRADAD